MATPSTEAPPVPEYRKARGFPFRLRQNTLVYLEDRNFLEGFRALDNLLTGGNSQRLPRGEFPPAFTPFPQQLILATTLVVHPQFTTRARSPEDLQASNQALFFVRNVLRIVGPVNAKFGEVFALSPNVFTKARKQARRRNQDTDSTSSDEEQYDLDSPFAHQQSVFAQKKDFWQIVGWAFTCSVAHKQRWNRWKLWLAFALDLLEADFRLRWKLTSESGHPIHVEDSIIMQYLAGAKNEEGGRNGRRDIMNAVLADGKNGQHKFSEVWKDETKERKVKEEELTAPKKVNLDEDEWGDYDFEADQDEVTDREIGSPESDESTTDTDEREEEEYGGLEAILLRQRIFGLLCEVACNCTVQFTSLEDVFDIFTEFFRPLPLPVFTSLINKFPLSSDNQCALLVNLCLPFLATTYANINVFAISQDRLIRDFFPYAANSNSALENAKFSRLIQTLLRKMWGGNRLDPFDPDLRTSIERGIAARKAKAIGDGRTKDKGQNRAEAEAKKLLEYSAESILAILEQLKIQAGMPVYSDTGAGAKGPLLSSQLSSVADEDVDDDTLMD
ncbi:hypothetical protein EJ08DRAFT_656027 [Tothia fuscella]|uniref:Uncharacterized protein n=1 Tax=Tothia fuscella TaxID=1048955 RepID=A0A9P4U384_9PEZI|nr:hypothetical protein EJ08DRAFT_656027 [Tothia fuscella]